MLASPIRPAMRSPLQQAMDRIGSAAIWTPATLFAASEQGVWYDPSDFSTLFQDAAGTVPVTATGQVVGLMLDKSKGLTLGSELVTNGDGSSVTGWGNFNANSSLSSVSGSLRVTINSGTSGYATQTITTVAGKTYAVTFTIVGATKSTTRFLVGTGSGLANLYSGTNLPLGAKTAVFTATTASSFLTIGMDVVVPGDYIDFDNISIRELPGNHATQATEASRPVLQQDGNGKHYLAFDGVDDSMATAAINFTATDKMSVFEGVRTAALSGIICELSPSGGVGSFYTFVNSASNYEFSRRGSGTLATTFSGTVVVPNTSTLTYVVDLSQAVEVTAQLRNGIAAGSVGSADTGTGNFGNYPLFIGSRAGTSLRFNGHIYSLIVRGALSDAAQIAAAEAYVNSKTGAY